MMCHYSDLIGALVWLKICFIQVNFFTTFRKFVWLAFAHARSSPSRRPHLSRVPHLELHQKQGEPPPYIDVRYEGADHFRDPRSLLALATIVSCAYLACLAWLILISILQNDVANRLAGAWKCERMNGRARGRYAHPVLSSSEIFVLSHLV